MQKARRASVLTTLMFTDIVASTAMAEEMGDRRWRELLARHHGILREALREFRGKELDTAGDGVFARFDSPASAIRCAWSIGEAVRELGIEIRAGVHIGECEVLGGKLSGVNVHVGARTMAEAGAGEILVTGSVRDLVRGGGFGFADRGMHELRGIAGDWHLFEITSVDGAPRPPRLRRRRKVQARRDRASAAGQEAQGPADRNSDGARPCRRRGIVGPRLRGGPFVVDGPVGSPRPGRPASRRGPAGRCRRDPHMDSPGSRRSRRIGAVQRPRAWAAR